MLPTADQPTKKVVKPDKTSIPDRSFYHDRKWVKGSYLIEIVRKNPNGKLFYDAFQAKYGTEVADKMAISLMYENATMWEKTVGVCDDVHQIGGDYRNCSYANLNSAGMDMGVKQINSYFQSEPSKKYPTGRIHAMGGPDCRFKNKAESKERKAKCNIEIFEWLKKPENNLKITMNLYEEQGFNPWYGYRKAFK